MFAVLHVPDFALQCVLRREPELRNHALALTDGALPACVRQMTPAARAHGVAAGMTTTQALGRCPSLLFRTTSPLDAESACLLQCAERFSPWLEATGEGVVSLELRLESERPTKTLATATACHRRAGEELSFQAERSEAEMAADEPRSASPRSFPAEILLQDLAACDFTARIGIAATPDLALLAAHCARPVLQVESAADFLAELPLEVLTADADAQGATPAAAEMRTARAEVFQLLHRWGITTLGGFAALPREDVVARLGPAAAALWDRASGRAVRPLRLVRVPEIFAEAMELEHEVETLEPLLFLLRRFTEQLTARLAAAYRVAATLRLTLRFAAGAPHVRELRIPAPTGDVDVLFRVLSTHLESVTAEAPIIAVELCAQATRAEQKQFNLFETGLRDPNKFFETLARLQALLGPERAGTPVTENTYRADAFHFVTPRFEESPPDAVPEPISKLPLQRFRPPLPAQVHTMNDRPASVFSDQAFGEVTACRGPWISSGDWWEDGRVWMRTEWDIEVGEQLYRLARQGDAWFIDGTYD
jgi:protein ImuB